jgi:2-methylisocitrate lyase-like PEP mutase family enzyme
MAHRLVRRNARVCVRSHTENGFGLKAHRGHERRAAFPRELRAFFATSADAQIDQTIAKFGEDRCNPNRIYCKSVDAGETTGAHAVDLSRVEAHARGLRDGNDGAMANSPRIRFSDAMAAAAGGASPVYAPLCLDPLTARMLDELGFNAGYLSGGALGFQYAISEALLTVTEIADVARRITSRSDLPLIVDGGVGFGDPVHVSRAVWEFERAGAVAVEFEDQVAPKRVHHHVGVEHLVPVEEMCAKITAAAEARDDASFQIIARTGGMANESVEAGIARLQAYVEAGADIGMALCRPADHARVAAAVEAPMSTITSLDQRPATEWAELGWSLIIDAFTAQALAISSTRDAYRQFLATGQTGAEIDGMGLHRELIDLCGLRPLVELEQRTTELGSEPRYHS